MKDKLVRFWKENKWLIIAISIAIIAIFGIFLVTDRLYILMQDQQVNYEIFYEEWIRLVENFIKTGEFPFYSWNTFLGTDFMTSRVYYLSGDIFLPLYILSPFSLNLTLMGVTMLLLYISAISFNYYLKEFGIKDHDTRKIISFVYALTGLAVLYFANFMFHRFYAFLPLLLLGVERFIKHKKLSLFAIMVCIEFLQCYYFMFPTTFFLILYYLFSYYYKKENAKIMPALLSALPLIGAYIIGFLMSAFLMVPMLLQMLNHPRVGYIETQGTFWEFKVIIGFIFSMITPPFNLVTHIPYIFISGWDGHAFWYSIYSSILVLITSLQFILFGEKKRERKVIRITFLVFLAFLFILPLNSIIHGFSEPSFRWVFLYVFLICLISAISLNEAKEYTSNLTKGYGIFTIIFLIAFFVGLSTKIIELPYHVIHVGVSLVCLLIGWLYVFLLKRGKRKQVFLLTVVELIIAASATCYILSKPYYYFEQSIHKEYVQYYREIDDDLAYRMFIDHIHLQPSTDLNLNQSVRLGFMSTATYDTIYEPNLIEFLRYNGLSGHILELKNPDVLKMLGVKYYIVYDEGELPTNYQFNYVYDLDYLKVYQLEDYYQMGFTYNQFRLKDTITDNDTIDWLNELVVDQEFLNEWGYLSDSKIERQQWTLTEFATNSLKAEITISEDTVLFMSIPYNKGWKILDNGEQVEYYKVQGGFLAIVLEEGEHHITMQFTSHGFKLGVTLSALGLIGIIGLIYYDRRILRKI